MSGTCLSSKRVFAIPGKDTWTAQEWAAAFVTHLMLIEWGMPVATDSKFLSDFWTAIFQRLNVALLFSTAWHAQTNGQDERTNAIIEMAIRYLMTRPGSDGNWLSDLPFITH